MEISEQAARQALIEQAREIAAAEQAKRAVPLTAAEWRQACEKWMYSTCIPGRLLPQLVMGKGAVHPDWIPIERRLIMA